MRESQQKEEYPELGYADYIIGYMFEIGYPSHDQASVPWREIKAWSQMSGVGLSPGEARLIYRLFCHFVNEKHRFERSEHEPAPYISNPAEQQAAKSTGLRAMLKRAGSDAAARKK